MFKRSPQTAGSRCLLEYLARWRGQLDARVCEAAGATQIRWLDFRGHDAWPGMDFLPDSSAEIREAWASFWPAEAEPVLWDAAGMLTIDSHDEWLLVKAKARTAGVRLHSRARGKDRKRIQAAYGWVAAALHPGEEADWLKDCFEFSAALAALHFLHFNGYPARLVWIFFHEGEDGAASGAPTREEWDVLLARADAALALPAGHRLEESVSRLFLPMRAC